MARFRLAALLALAFSVSQSSALASPDEPSDAELEQWLAEQTAEVSFLVVGSFSSYASALRTVERVHRAAGLEVDLRGLGPVGSGLSLSREDSGEGYDYPCWYPRGRRGSETTLSIEVSVRPSAPPSACVIPLVGRRRRCRLGRHGQSESDRRVLGAA